MINLGRSLEMILDRDEELCGLFDIEIQCTDPALLEDIRDLLWTETITWWSRL